jgi:hypothetical protein
MLQDKEKAYDASNWIMACIDVERKGYIDYTEFLMGALEKSELLLEVYLEITFRAFD